MTGPPPSPHGPPPSDPTSAGRSAPGPGSPGSPAADPTAAGPTATPAADAPPSAWAGTFTVADEGTSTMDLARERPTAPHGHSWLLARQTCGRGRRGRSWASAGHAGVWMTTLLHLPWRDDLATLALVAGCSVLAVVRAAGAVGARLKWPNDIWVAGRKLAGVLLEADGPPREVALCRVRVGVGINLAPPPAAVAGAGLVELLPDGRPPLAEDAWRRQLAAALGARLQRDVRAWQQAGLAPFAATFARHDALAGTLVQVSPGGATPPWRGRAAGIDARGRLRVVTEAGLRRVAAGEVDRLRPCRPGASPTGAAGGKNGTPGRAAVLP